MPSIQRAGFPATHHVSSSPIPANTMIILTTANQINYYSLCLSGTCRLVSHAPIRRKLDVTVCHGMTYPFGYLSYLRVDPIQHWNNVGVSRPMLCRELWNSTAVSFEPQRSLCLRNIHSLRRMLTLYPSPTSLTLKILPEAMMPVLLSKVLGVPRLSKKRCWIFSARSTQKWKDRKTSKVRPVPPPICHALRSLFDISIATLGPSIGVQAHKGTFKQTLPRQRFSQGQYLNSGTCYYFLGMTLFNFHCRK